MQQSNCFQKKSQCMPLLSLKLPITSHFTPKIKAKLLPVAFQPLTEPQAHSVQARLVPWQFSKLSSHTFILRHSPRSLPLFGLLFSIHLSLSPLSRFCSYVFFPNITCPPYRKLQAPHSLTFMLLFFLIFFPQQLFV